MKKLLLFLTLSLAIGNLSFAAADDVLTSVQKELYALEQKEIARFKVEERNAAASTQNYINYMNMIDTANNKISELELTEPTSIYAKENKAIAAKYKNIVKELEKKAQEEKRKVDEFNQLKQIMNY